jgi:hypothetical protein
LNTVKRYDRASEPERLQRVPKYKPTLVDPHRDYLRKRRAEEPGVAVQQLLREIRERGYQGSSNLLVRYINQGRLDGGRPHLSPRRATRLLLTRPDRLTGSQQETLARIEAACPEISALASQIRDFAALLAPDPGNAGRLQEWITAARAADLPHLHAFTRGLDLDIQAAAAALTMPFHNGRTEGVNTKTKMIKRQMYGRAGFALLRHRILLGLRNVTTGSATEPLIGHAPLDPGPAPGVPGNRPGTRRKRAHQPLDRLRSFRDDLARCLFRAEGPPQLRRVTIGCVTNFACGRLGRPWEREEGRGNPVKFQAARARRGRLA